MSDRSGGFFSSVGRFFSSSKNNNQSEKSTPSSPTGSISPSSSRSPVAGSAFLKDIIKIDGKNDNKLDLDSSKVCNNLRYLSPSALDSNVRKTKSSLLNDLDADTDPVSDIFSSTSTTLNRKRQLMDTEKTLTQTFNNDGVKRSKFLNRSLMESNLKSTIGTPKLDTTWCGEFSMNHSPASSVTNFSLLSRRSGANSNGSNLSSRTQQIFRRLEQASTPAKDVQRMSMIRAGLNRPERWATASSNNSVSSDAPPLRKVGESIPSRIQLLSKKMAISSTRKPYWRDLTRRRSEQKNCDKEIDSSSVTSKTTNGSMSTELSSLFTDVSEKEQSKNNEKATKKHQSTVKGSDGKAIGRNTFKLSENYDDIRPLPDNWITNAKITLDSSKAPARGFLGDLSFSFAAPSDAVSNITSAPKESAKESTNEISDEDNTSEKNSKESGTESSSDESSSEDDLSESEDEKESNDVQKPDDSRAPTSTDTVSPAASLASSKDSSPKNDNATTTTEPTKTAVAANWTCDGCFTSWPESNTECGCCGQKKGGEAKNNNTAPAQKSLVSNLASFAPAKSTGVTFGFGASSSTSLTLPSAAPAPTSTQPPAPAAVSSSTANPITSTTSIKPISSGSLFGNSAVSTTESKTESKSESTPSNNSADTNRVAWECPTCMVSNKATDDKCVCCEYVKYKSAETSDNIFGNRAFKPSSVSGTLFGTGSATPAASFGFGVSADKKDAPVNNPSATVADQSAKVDLPKAEPPKENVSLFGSLASKPIPTFGASTGTTSNELKAPLFGTGGSLFGSSKPTEVPKPAEPIPSNATKPILFGSAPAPVDEKKNTPSLTGFSSTFGSDSPFGSMLSASKSTAASQEPTQSQSSLPPSNPVPAPLPTITFGSTSLDTQKPSSGLFGNLSSSTSSVPSSTTTGLFGSTTSAGSQLVKPAESKPLFGSSTLPSFGADAGTTTTDGGVPAKKGLFSTGPADSTTSAPKLTFGSGSTAPATNSTFGFGSSNLTPSGSSTSLFGMSAPTTTSASGQASQAPFSFGSSSSTISAFGSSTSSTSTFGSAPAPSFGSSAPAPSFGSSNTGAFGGFGANNSAAAPALKPTISNSSSTSSLFNQATESPFQMNSTAASNGFNFGSSSSTALGGNGVFVFGSSAPAPAIPTAPSGGAFQFGAAPSGAGMESAFAYQPSTQTGPGARKMAMARRRNLRK